ncbi:MAG: pyrroline-5-carboxylate reductase [Firmicutes bacterium]|jgi:pyrroline-5-carboxylate reductase|nr:pyrroline-5-carboxylate reductase [Bacillota bacterium]
MKIGFVGMGNMAKALAIGFIKSGYLDCKDVFAYAPNQEKLRKNSQKIGFIPCSSAGELSQSCDVVFAACKPYQMEKVFGAIKDELKGKTVVSVAAGWDFEKLSCLLGDEVKVQYILPNTPVEICNGVIVMENVSNMGQDERLKVKKLLESVGKVVELPGNIMGAASSVSGCGPAFIAMVIEGLADGAVKNGVPRAQAYELVCSMMIGTAKLQLETGTHPGEMKDNVCSPGGSTIRGVSALEEAGLRNALIKAVDASIN